MVDGIGSQGSYKSAHRPEQAKTERASAQGGNLFASVLEPQERIDFEFSTLEAALSRAIPLELTDIIAVSETQIQNDEFYEQVDAYSLGSSDPTGLHASMEELWSIDLYQVLQENQSRDSFASEQSNFFDELDDVVKNTSVKFSFLSLGAPAMREAVKMAFALKDVEDSLVSQAPQDELIQNLALDNELQDERT